MWSILLILFGAFGCGITDNDFYFDPPEPPEDEDRTQDTFHLGIDLQDGFSADRVEVEVNGELVWEGKEVTTALLTGLADSFDIQVAGGPLTLTVRIPSQNTFASIGIEMDGDRYVGVSVVDQVIKFFVSEFPFGYG